jgi:hypothetical protein
METVNTRMPSKRTLAVIDGGLAGNKDVCVLTTFPKPKLLDQVRQAIRTRHYSYRTEKAYVHWIKRFIFFTTNVIRWKWAKRKSHNFFRALLVTRM